MYKSRQGTQKMQITNLTQEEIEEWTNPDQNANSSVLK